MRRVYVAGTFGDRSKLKHVVKRIRAATDLEVSSSWMYEGDRPKRLPHETWFEKLAHKDWYEIRYADLLILDTRTRSPRGGKNVEFGIALALGKMLMIVGPMRNVFESLADYRFKTWKACIQHLKEMEP